MGRVKELFGCMGSKCANILETPEEWNCGFCEECFENSLKSFEKFSTEFDENVRGLYEF